MEIKKIEFIDKEETIGIKIGIKDWGWTGIWAYKNNVKQMADMVVITGQVVKDIKKGLIQGTRGTRTESGSCEEPARLYRFKYPEGYNDGNADIETEQYSDHNFTCA